MTTRNVVEIMLVAFVATLLFIGALMLTFYGIIIGHWWWIGPTLLAIIIITAVGAHFLRIKL